MMFKELFAGHETTIILIIVIFLISIGKGSGVLLVQLLKRVIGKGPEVNFNMGRMDDEMDRHEGKMKTLIAQGDHCLIDPTKCVACPAEHERSEENKSKIEKLDREFEQFKSSFFVKLGSIESGISEIKVSIAKFH